jgi:chromosomal replication initiation ATPase DnaA
MNIYKRRADDEAAARLAAEVAGYGLGVPGDEILSLARGAAETAFARQVAMYLCHVAFALSLSRVAVAFGRDRSTVAHACHAIEDRRDDEPFDAWIGALEGSLREAPSPVQQLAGAGP